MAKRFIGYFDILGYKEFIERNDLGEQSRRIGHLLRDIERALSLDHSIDDNGHYDISKSNINCITISDTIIFFSDDDSLESLDEFLKVVFEFNRLQVRFNFAIRGALGYGNIEMYFGDSPRNNRFYRVSNLFGLGLIEVHLEANKLNLSGTILMASLKEFISLQYPELIEDYFKLYNVPFKKHIAPNRYLLKILNNDIEREYFANYVRDIKNTFNVVKRGDNKDYDPFQDNGVKAKYENTIEYLKTYIKVNP